VSIEFTSNFAGQPIVKFNCPKCNLRLTAKLLEAGNVETCSECATTFKVPGEQRRKTYEDKVAREKRELHEKQELKKEEAALERIRKTAEKAEKKKMKQQASVTATRVAMPQTPNQAQPPPNRQPKRVASPTAAQVILTIMLMITVVWGLTAIGESFSILLNAETIMQQIAAIGDAILAGVLWLCLLLGIIGIEVLRLLHAIATKDENTNR
jgi:cation transport ATPase